MTSKLRTRGDLASTIAYLQKQLDHSFDRIDELNKYIITLQEQIKAMGGIPLKPERR